MTDNTQEYEVSFTLRQNGKDGEISAELSFSHPLSHFKNDEDVPETYSRMLSVAQMYLELTGFVDERGNLIPQDDYAEAVYVEAAKPTRLN